jgi:serine O-acetyltransferase
MLSSSERNVIYADLNRWGLIYRFSKTRGLVGRVILFVWLMTWLREYRNVFYLRTGFPGKLLSFLCRRMSSLYLACDSIGPGLFVQHGEGTLIAAEQIGENCWINQQVTVGYTNEVDRPTIGKNVTIHAGAKILGKVTVGDNSTIGANSVVISDVPSSVTVIGVPAKVVWKKPAA